jgi:SAM-dependent methyltransferase
MSLGRGFGDSRTDGEIREHYELERGLARRLLGGSRAERPALYRELYDELFRKLPHHPLLRRKEDPAEMAARTRWKLALLDRFLNPESVLVEIGAGDCSLSLAVARRVAAVVAVDISEEITAGIDRPANFRLVLSDGRTLPLPPASATIAYSNQLMEHLHPDDAIEQLRSVYEVLRPGGWYLCVTPNRLSGPHDVSKHFDDVATGFHLREYTLGELGAILRRVGFGRLRVWAGGRGVYLRQPVMAQRAVEAVVGWLPAAVRKPLARSLPGQALLVIQVAAQKPAA